MTLMASQIEEVLSEFRRILPAQTGTARAIDAHAPVEEIAAMAITDGYIDSAEDFLRLVDACLRRA
jgi:hypothetical protein